MDNTNDSKPSETGPSRDTQIRTRITRCLKNLEENLYTVAGQMRDKYAKSALEPTAHKQFEKNPLESVGSYVDRVTGHLIKFLTRKGLEADADQAADYDFLEADGIFECTRSIEALYAVRTLCSEWECEELETAAEWVESQLSAAQISTTGSKNISRRLGDAYRNGRSKIPKSIRPAIATALLVLQAVEDLKHLKHAQEMKECNIGREELPKSVDSRGG